MTTDSPKPSASARSPGLFTVRMLELIPVVHCVVSGSRPRSWQRLTEFRSYPIGTERPLVDAARSPICDVDDFARSTRLDDPAARISPIVSALSPDGSSAVDPVRLPRGSSDR